MTPRERERYARHLILPEIGEAGQEKLRAASVLVIGAGGLGSPLLMYLAAAGVGRLGIVDDDVVDRTNLQRQVLYGEASVGEKKVVAAAARVNDINDGVTVEQHAVRFTSENGLALARQYDIVIDGTDNFTTRYLVNDACVLLGKPNVYGSIFRFEGQLSVFDAQRGPCYRCLYPEPPPAGSVPSCAEGGVLGVLPGIVGTLQATEAIKLITGIGEPMIGRMLLIDTLGTSFRQLRLKKNPSCPMCGEGRTITQLKEVEESCSIVNDNITATELNERLRKGDDLFLLDVREPMEWDAGHLEQAKHVPLRQVPGALGDIPRDREIVCICRSGGRSAQAQQYLRQNGYDRVLNLSGGMKSWAASVDPGVTVV
jgi:molybdopterin/thiamine biosynthesis adenylyltransferase/rhodanese-related sulfurtransferase